MMIGYSYGFRAEKVTNSRTGSLALVISRLPALSPLELEQPPPGCPRAAPGLGVRSGYRLADPEPPAWRQDPGIARAAGLRLLDVNDVADRSLHV
jgi:hypothetical protein